MTLYLDECLAVLKSLPDSSVDSVVTDPPYAITAIPNIREAFKGGLSGACSTCATDDTLPGYVLCGSCLDEASDHALANAPMLGMQSQNWHAKATHSRGYVDNDNRQFERWCLLWASECYRVLKPGGHIIAFGGTRTWHRLASAIEDAGFTVRDSLAWLFATGFPKSLNVSRAIDRAQKSRRSMRGRVTGRLGWPTVGRMGNRAQASP